VRRTITLLMIVVGLALMVVSYFFLAAPWGADDVAHSNPILQFAPALFVLGVLLVFSAAVVYEVLPDREE